MTTYTQEQREKMIEELRMYAREISPFGDSVRAELAILSQLAAPSTSMPLTLDQIHDALQSVCDDGSAPTSTDDPEFIELIVPLARAIEAKIKGGA